MPRITHPHYSFDGCTCCVAVDGCIGHSRCMWCAALDLRHREDHRLRLGHPALNSVNHTIFLPSKPLQEIWPSRIGETVADLWISNKHKVCTRTLSIKSVHLIYDTMDSNLGWRTIAIITCDEMVYYLCSVTRMGVQDEIDDCAGRAIAGGSCGLTCTENVDLWAGCLAWFKI